MEELIAKLIDKCGLSEEQAKKVASFLSDHADDVPKWIGSSGLKDKLPGGIGKLF